MKEDSLIFIISQPRSGSTYLQNLLSNNKYVNTCSEPWILLQSANFFKPKLIEATFENDLAQWAYNNYVAKFPNTNFTHLHKEFILSLYSPMAEGFQFVIDKTPRYWELIEQIPILFPKAKMIVLKRNPIDVAISIMRTWQLDTLTSFLQFKRDLLLAPFVLDSFQEKYKDYSTIKVLRYEDLTGNKKIITDLYKWIDIPFDDAVFNIENNEKIKGDFGDPYQNTLESYKEARKTQSDFKPSKWQLKWLQGYADFLGQDFLYNYGEYDFAKVQPNKTLVFSYFRSFNSQNNKKSLSYKRKVKNFLLGLFYK